MSSSQKIPSMVAMPVTKHQNQMYFHLSGDERPVDMKSSYLELEMGFDTTIDTHNVVLGHDGLFYPPSSLFRQAKLTKSQTGEVLQDLSWVNVLDANLRHYHTGCNEVVSDAIFSGAGHIDPADKSIKSVFSNTYSDENPTLRVPLENLYPGSIGQTNNLPLGSGDCEFRFLMEQQYPVLMKAVPAGVYDVGSSSNVEYGFKDMIIGATALSAGTTGIINNFSTGNVVVINGQVGGGLGYDLFVRTVGTVTADNGITGGSFTFTPALSTTAPVANVKVVKESNTHPLACNALEIIGNTVNLVTPSSTKDLLEGTKVKVHYTLATSGIAITYEEKVLETTVTSITVNGSNNITSVVFSNNIPILNTQIALNIWIDPLYTNMDSVNWQVLSAHMVVYRRNIPIKSEKMLEKMLVQNFESSNVLCVAGLNRFLYNYKVRPSTYNVWAIQPTQTNLYSQAQNIGSYLYTLDERPLTSIYLEVNGAVHNDNLGRVCANSPIYKLKNLRGNRDREINSAIEPIVFTAKLYNAMLSGESNVIEGDDRNLRIELVPESGSSTSLTNVFLFMEKYQQL